MSERSRYDSGTFSWVDLATTDPDGAKAFYAGLFGWEFEDLPTDGSGTYTMCRLQGKDVCAIARQSDQERQQGVPSHWNSYITAHDLDDRAARIPELNGNLIMPPFDVMEAGRMALAVDPTGAVFALWEPRNSIGAALVNVHGALTWNELGTTDVEAAKSFYGELFGWTYEDLEMDGQGSYSIVRNGGSSNGGIRAQTQMEKGVPPNWLPYFGATSCDESAAQAQAVGGRVLVPTMHVPAGGFAVIADPQGAVFAVFEGEFDD
jgi:predicted enzyme related to lactoylglutathione lyase